MAKLVKLQKSDPVVEMIKKIKTLKGNEIVFELPENSEIFKNQHNLVLVKKSAAAMGITVMIRTDDLNGRSMAAKAGLLLDTGDSEYQRPTERPKTKKVRFSDIGASDMKRAAPAAMAAAPIARPPVSGMRRPTPPSRKFFSWPSFSWLRFPTIGSNFSRVFVLSIVILVLVVFGIAVLLPQAQITVYARSEPIVRDIEVSVDSSIRTINSSKLTVPGESVNQELSHTKNFQTTGIKLTGTKATGTVQLYNFTKNTLTLRAATTTLIVDGKKYSFTRDVTGLRPTARIGQGGEQEIDKSSLIAPVPIAAADVGANFNLAIDTRMTLQNSALGQADVYGESASAITGGTSTEIKVVSQQDIDNATKAMQNELPALAQAEVLKTSANQSTKVLSNAVNSEILAKTTNKEVGDETANFDMTVIAKVTGLSYNEENLRSLIIEKINSVLSEDKYLVEDGKQELGATFKAVDITKGTGVLAVHFETIAAYKVENSNLSKILAGKDALEIKEILLTKPEIDRVDVQFSPFFVNKAPRFNGKIYIKTIQSQS
jgi:hypothetical protein